MRNNTIINNIIFLLLVISTGVNAYLIKNKMATFDIQNKINISNKMRIVNLEDKIIDILNQGKLEFITKNKKLSTNISVTNEQEQKKILRELVKDPTIVIYWDTRYCNECYEDFLKILSQYYDKIKLNTIIMGNFNSNREFQRFLNSRNILFKSYFLNNPDELNIPLQESPLPFVFTLDTNLSISNVFTIQKTTVENYRFFLIETINQLQNIQ